jgi:hypothetical protein
LTSPAGPGGVYTGPDKITPVAIISRGNRLTQAIINSYGHDYDRGLRELGASTSSLPAVRPFVL